MLCSVQLIRSNQRIDFLDNVFLLAKVDYKMIDILTVVYIK